MNTARNLIIELIKNNTIHEEQIPEALIVLHVIPNGSAWRKFIDHFLLWLGGLALAFAVLFFIAYNWTELGRFAKFGMVEAALVLAIVTYCYFDKDKVIAKVALLMAAIFLGVLLALFGQTYQTGADPWQLFCNWAILMLPWAVIGRFAAIWIVWLSLVNVSLILFYQTFGGVFGILFSSESELIWIVGILNTFVLVVWETLTRMQQWSAERWALRLVAIGGVFPITWLVLIAINNYSADGVISWLIWIVWLAGGYVIYRKKIADLFMLAIGCLSVMVVIVTFLSKHLLEVDAFDGFGALLLTVVIIGLGTGAAVWLKNVHREMVS
ncbi:DUF2157 domain-containing protein [Desulfopila sp. IMCC35008]|uniref:DUF2157 domain-containing protein n=1 Tax=Desulfopila sp. IMCC35008 TaxID=2653858 RepID=UPI0013D5D545|nr:DUF2157 domain-containing protein [Desulfopila sp. IMCC35008]